MANEQQDRSGEDREEETHAGTDDTPLQDEETREGLLEHAERGQSTATGHAARREEEEERLEDLESRGGPEDVQGEVPDPDDEPIGLQAEEAQYSATGTVPPRMVATPSGPMPIASVARSPEEATQRLQAQADAQREEVRRRTERRAELTEAQIRSLSGAEARAALESRFNYAPADTANLSNRAARETLLQEQSERSSKREAEPPAEE